LSALAQFFKTIGAARLAAMGAVAAGLIGIFIFLMLRLSQPQMATLYSELPFDESASVVRKLDGMNITYELRNEGATILVPKSVVLKTRMSLAQDGLPAGRVVGYEIFDKTDTLGTTSFVQTLNHLRALEGELSRTIRALDVVQLARVHLVLPKRQLFSRAKTEPTASIVLRLRGDLSSGQVRAIQHIVASAVKGLRPSRVSIVDESGTLLASGEDNRAGGGLSRSMVERNLAFERQLRAKLQDIVASVVGRGKSRVQVSAELDYNRMTRKTETYDPDGQVVRSTQTREESASTNKTAGGKSVSVGNELPAADGSPDGGGKPVESNQKTEEVVNYEISRTTKTEVVEAGRLKRVSVAVLVDGLYSKGAGGKPVYTPRTKEQLDRIAALVRSTIGFDRARGDQVEVANLRFAPEPAPEALAEADEGFLNLSKEDYFYIAELAILLILAVLVLLFIVRPLVRRIVTPDEETAAIDHMSTPAGSAAPGQIEGPENLEVGLPDDVKALLGNDTSKAAALIDVAQVAGEVHGKTVKKIGDLVQANPDEAIAIVRQWLQEKAA